MSNTWDKWFMQKTANERVLHKLRESGLIDSVDSKTFDTLVQLEIKKLQKYTGRPK